MPYAPIVKTLFKSLFHKTPTVSYPYAPMPTHDSVRGRVEIEIGGCSFCGACARRCPADAITTDRIKKEWEIAPYRCVVCSACVDVCPKKCLFMRPTPTPVSDAVTTEKFSGA